MLKRLGILAVATMTLISCADRHDTIHNLQPQNPQSFQSDNGLQLFNHNMLEVVDQAGQPIPGATILVGYENGNPFQGNVLTTNATGGASVPADWKAALPVTVQAPGFVTNTIPVALPGDHTITMTPQEGAIEFEIAGVTNGFGRLPTDGRVDFALVIPALNRESLLSFELAKVMSPQVDTIEILGNELKVPSNLSLPQQRENFIFPIEFNKPQYRSYVRNPGQYLLTTARGQFPLQRVVNDIRGGKSIFEVVNHFTFSESAERLVDVQANVAGVDIAVNQTPLATTANVTAPAYPAGLIMMSLALAEKPGGLLAPTDLKRLAPGASMGLKTVAGPTSMLSVLLEETATFINPLSDFFNTLVDITGGQMDPAEQKSNQPNFTKFSSALLPASGGVAPQFLPMIAPPALNGDVLTLDTPALPAGLTAVATYLVLNEVEEIAVGKVLSERRTRLWEVWSNAWLGQVELPKIQFTRRPDRKYRWEVMFMARPSNFVGIRNSSGVDLNSVTHVTRNATSI